MEKTVRPENMERITTKALAEAFILNRSEDGQSYSYSYKY